jgi:hypothetical protein
MQCLEAQSRKDLQKLAKEWGIKVRMVPSYRCFSVACPCCDCPSLSIPCTPGFQPSLQYAYLQANIKSDEIREQLVQKGFTASRSSLQTGRDQPENCAPPSPKPSASGAETKLQGLSNRMRQRRNALHIRNGSVYAETHATASHEVERNASSPTASNHPANIDVSMVLDTPERGRASACIALK